MVQSVLREALRDMDGFEVRDSTQGAEGFGRWLQRVAEHKLKSRGRFWNRMRPSLSNEEPVPEADLHGLRAVGARSPSAATHSREALARIEAAFSDLPPAWREVVVLVRLQGLTHAEAARRLVKRSVVAVRDNALATTGGTL